jgi:hypothetical protein
MEIPFLQMRFRQLTHVLFLQLGQEADIEFIVIKTLMLCVKIQPNIPT